MPCLETQSMAPQVLLMYPGTRPTENGGTLWTAPEYRNPTQATTRPETRVVSLVTSFGSWAPSTNQRSDATRSAVRPPQPLPKQREALPSPAPPRRSEAILAPL